MYIYILSSMRTQSAKNSHNPLIYKHTDSNNNFVCTKGKAQENYKNIRLPKRLGYSNIGAKSISDISKTCLLNPSCDRQHFSWLISCKSAFLLLMHHM